jgi:crossover junction endodeoxyribonuclease RuvC
MPTRRSRGSRSGSSWRDWRPGSAVRDAADATERGPARRSRAVAPAVAPSRQVRVLGLDPGSQNTGFGIVDSGPAGTRYVASGTIVATRRRATTTAAAAADQFAARLQTIYAGVVALVAEHRPDEIAVERVFVHRNPDSALKLGQARGAALCGTFGSGATLHEYSPREVKLAVVGTGTAEKEQVQKMVKVLLGLDGRLGADAADALAIALCHAHGRGTALAVWAGTRTAGGREPSK